MITISMDARAEDLPRCVRNLNTLLSGITFVSRNPGSTCRIGWRDDRDAA